MLTTSVPACAARTRGLSPLPQTPRVITDATSGAPPPRRLSQRNSVPR